ncbi:MAG TPA: chromate transporter [Candidatus Binatia bacterium]
MKFVLLYLLLLKATMTSFGGLSSLPVLREDLVIRHQFLTDRQLNLAVTAGRAGPGPNGLYVVSVGYLVAGLTGAWLGWLAMVTPAFLIIPLVYFVGTRADLPRMRGAIRASTVASAGLLAVTTLRLAQGALTDFVLVGIAAVSFLIFSFSKIDSLWVILGSAAIGLMSAILGIQ